MQRIYGNNLKNRNFDKGTSQNFEIKPMQSKINPSRSFGIMVAIFIFSIFSSLFADEDCLCGIAKKDFDYAKALYLLSTSIEHTPFSYGGWFFPAVANDFHPPLEFREDEDDTYSFEGHVSWDITKSCYWHSKDLFKIDLINNYVTVPIKIIRNFDWTDHSNIAMNSDADRIIEFEHQEKNVIEFNKNYAGISQAFNLLKSDIHTYYEKSLLFLDARIKDLANNIAVYDSPRRITKQKKILEKKQKVQSTYQDRLNFIETNEIEALAACTASLDFCIDNHNSSTARINRGLFYYLEGNTWDALRQAEIALEKLKNDYVQLKEAALMLKGQSEVEAGLYADAIVTLSELISQNPANKTIYFERATAYFESGDFDLSLEDYLASQIKPQPISAESLEMTSFSLGLTKGILQGGAQAGIEFIPSLLSSLQGIAHGLWAFVQDPVQISKAFIQASQDCIQFIKEHTPQETLMEVVPELKELISNWDSLGNEKRGELTGHVIGKYGVDIFAGVGVTKAMKYYRELKHANNMLTFEAMAASERNKSLIKLEAAKRAETRKEVFQIGNLKIQPDKQGKHVVSHKNYQMEKNRSILEHPDPQKLVNEFAGKGTKVSNQKPGVPGYQEIVNFKEFIGYDVDPNTGKKLATTWGKIHYAKDGVHIVPTGPRG